MGGGKGTKGDAPPAKGARQHAQRDGGGKHGPKGFQKGSSKGARKGLSRGTAHDVDHVDRTPPHRPRTPPAQPYDGKPACYVTGKGLDDRHCVLGIGIGVRRGELSTPMELLSLEAFHSGTRSSRNGRMRFQHFLPLSICADHHRAMVVHHDRLKDTIEDVLCSTGRRRVVEKEKFAVQMSFFAGQLLGYLLREMLTARTKDHLRRAIDCYFAVTLTLERVDIAAKGAVAEFAADRVVRPFVAAARRRMPEALPDLGAFVGLLPFAGTKWADVAPLVTQQAIARGIFDTVLGYPPEPGPYPELLFSEGRKDAASFCAKMWASEPVREQLRSVLVYAAVATSTAELSGDAIAEQKICMPAELKEKVWKARGALEACGSWDEFVEAAGFPRTRESLKRDRSGHQTHRMMFLRAIEEADLPEFRHDAFAIFKKAALARMRPLAWNDIGKPGEDGKINSENRLYDFLSKDLPDEP